MDNNNNVPRIVVPSELRRPCPCCGEVNTPHHELLFWLSPEREQAGSDWVCTCGYSRKLNAIIDRDRTIRPVWGAIIDLPFGSR